MCLKKENLRARMLLMVHLLLLLAVGAFFLYAWLVKAYLPARFYHCAMHDILHFYCPLCGGTRAAAAILSFDLKSALQLAPTVFLLFLFLFIIDVRAWAIVWKKENEREIFPYTLLKTGAALLLFSTAFRNALMLWGLDPAGDLLYFWHSRFSRGERILESVLCLLSTFFLFLGAFPPKKHQKHVMLVSLTASLVLFVLLVALRFALS